MAFFFFIIATYNISHKTNENFKQEFCCFKNALQMEVVILQLKIQLSESTPRCPVRRYDFPAKFLV